MKAVKDSLVGKVALVTGAGSGIGKATAKLLSYAGARVALLGHHEKEIEETANELRRGKCHEALALVADVSDTASMEKAVASVEGAWRRLDIVVANAGVNGVWAPLEEISDAEWDETLAVNLKGTFLTIRSCLPLLKARGGAVVVTSSINGTRIFSNTGATAYSCSKAAQIALVKMLAVELGPYRIRINAICPGEIETRIGDSRREKHLESVRIPVEYPAGHIPLTHDKPGTAGEVAELAWFLSSDFANHITGTEIYIDGAQSLLQG